MDLLTKGKIPISKPCSKTIPEVRTYIFWFAFTAFCTFMKQDVGKIVFINFNEHRTCTVSSFITFTDTSKHFCFKTIRVFILIL